MVTLFLGFVCSFYDEFEVKLKGVDIKNFF
jgi:hypothetical protein